MNSSFKNAFLMLAPCALLVGVGVMLKNRKPAVLTIKEVGHFKTYIKSVRLVPITPGEVHDGYDTKVEVELGASGPLPAWWVNGFGGYMGHSSGQLVARREGTSSVVGTTPFCWRPHFDANSKRWISTYAFKLVPLKAGVGEIHLRDRVQILSNANMLVRPLMWFDLKVRAAGVATPLPPVSHDPHLKITRLVVDEAPPVDSKGATDQYRLKMWFNKLGLLKGMESYGVSDSLKICDPKGRVSSLNNSMYGSEEFNENSYDGPPNPIAHQQSERHAYNVHTFTLPHAGSGDGGTTLQPPLTIQGSSQFGSNWPMWIKVPLTDSQGKLLLSPRPKPAFHVTGTSVRSATTQEKTDYGADTVVSLTLGALAPNVDVTKWKWRGHFSQHIETARTTSIWSFLFKGGAQPALVSYQTDGKQMTVNYYMVLGSIPASAGTLTLVAGISGNNSSYLPVKVVVRSAVPKPAPSSTPMAIPTATGP